MKSCACPAPGSLLQIPNDYGITNIWACLDCGRTYAEVEGNFYGVFLNPLHWPGWPQVGKQAQGIIYPSGDVQP